MKKLIINIFNDLECFSKIEDNIYFEKTLKYIKLLIDFDLIN